MTTTGLASTWSRPPSANVRNSGISTRALILYSVSSRYNSLYLAHLISRCAPFRHYTDLFYFTGISGPSPCLCILCQCPIHRSLLSKSFLCFSFFFLLISRNETMGRLSTNIKTLCLSLLSPTFRHATSYISASSC